MTSRWNFGRPANGATIVERHKLSVRAGGQVWNGHWEVEGEKMHVCSAYGSRTISAGPETTRAARAEGLLAEIVKARPPSV